jgi:hypothetical protein
VYPFDSFENVIGIFESYVFHCSVVKELFLQSAKGRKNSTSSYRVEPYNSIRDLQSQGK